MDHNQGIDLRPGNPGIHQGREKDAERKAKAKKKKKDPKVKVTNFPVL